MNWFIIFKCIFFSLKHLKILKRTNVIIRFTWGFLSDVVSARRSWTMLPIQSQIFMTEDNEDLFPNFLYMSMSSAHPDPQELWLMEALSVHILSTNLGQEKGQDKLRHWLLKLLLSWDTFYICSHLIDQSKPCNLTSKMEERNNSN